MGSILQQTLRSLCSKTGWNYAVFWKLKHRSRMILTWEDGYYEYAKCSVVSNVFAPNLPFNGMESRGNPLDHGVFGQAGCCIRDHIGLTVAKMSYQIFSLGEGIVGHVAFTGKHQWIFGDESCINKANSIEAANGRTVLRYPTGWQNQFAAGIKTIAVVAVVPHGVVQLGSTQIIMEDLDLVNHIKTLFGALHNVPEAFLHDSVKHALSWKIQGPVSSMISMPLASLQDPPLLGARNPSSSHDQSNQSVPKSPSSSVLDLFGSPSDLMSINKSLHAQAQPLPSMENFGASADLVNHLSQFQQNRVQPNNFPAQVSNGQGTGRQSTAVRVVYPFQGHMQANLSLSANQQALFMGSCTGNYGLPLLEEQLPKELGLHGHLQLPSINVQKAVQPQFHGSMPAGFEGEVDFNPALGNVESISTGRLCRDNFRLSNRVDRLPGEELFNLGRPQLMAQKCIDMQPSVRLFRDVVGHSEHSSASSRPLAHNDQITETEATPMPLITTGVGNISCRAPTFSSANLQMSASGIRKPSNVSWSVSATNLDTRMLEALSNGLTPSPGDYGLSVSEACAIDQQPWYAEILAKDMCDLFQNRMVDNLNPVKESPKDSEAGFGELSATAGDWDESGGDGITNFDTNLPSNGQNKTGNSVSSLPAGAAVFGALGPSFKKGPDMCVWDEILFPREDECDANLGTLNFKVSAGSDCPSEVDITCGLDASIDREYEGCIFSEIKFEDLLDSLVANVCPAVKESTDDNMSNKTTSLGLTSMTSMYCTSVRSDMSSAGQLSGCRQKQSKVAGISQFRTNEDLGNGANPIVTSKFHGVAACPNESLSKTQLKSWVDESQCENPGLAQAKRPAEAIKGNRKRARPGESSRPRPKDRQQIQDHVRELREIVPNGAKCSIDVLLERTIKHMLFLQSVTKYADKLKQCGESKVHDMEGVFLATDDLEGGTSWAFELGGQTLRCPIIVENLNQARQMLVEMLCEKRGLFLEIADMIQSMGLTILNGVIEARNEKIWARFVVEANRDVHRLEILWSLVQLLEPSNNSSSTYNQSPCLS